mmetsp:Transcript_2943/g.4264  ORF Transcript_2943/g.4264 Transcript_2943/m.4264 type:complete len:577 (-) Transcript_2943:316-2046(-)|eukprot:CAMPEP_0184481408 /NCGR_PEP_ID=MMETSP0113_2-20130426/2954_1 /TAXON_ID=91329 /ORGANISM="Norrisiella sphaerica, Strain BC52" /LENGTH=576 /DNA_ID=CAMNT_0026860519 /DNA_START=155 /DNA_END=1885 /DNA_ORIENTATION=-
MSDAANTGISGDNEGKMLDECYECLNKLMSKTTQQLQEAVMTRDQIVKEMETYISALELDLSKLSVIHVAGTKGKGSTCAFVESILRGQGLKTGLFSSPHLIHINERIQLGGSPCLVKVFHYHFFKVWNTLRASKALKKMPRYFQFLTLVALHAFADPDLHVDVAILETGVGGRLDATNIFEKPVVTGITKIGYDHMNVLGSTLDAIASEKAGILKSGVPAYTCASQEPLAAKTLSKIAGEKKVLGSAIMTCPPLEKIDPLTKCPLELGLAGEHQRENASLALALANTFMKNWLKKASLAPKDAKEYKIGGRDYGRHFDIDRLRKSLKDTRWPGRCQILALPGMKRSKLCIDGAHTKDSCARAAEWFVSVVEAEKELLGDDRASNTNEKHKTLGIGLVYMCGVGRDPAEQLIQIFQRTQAMNIQFNFVYSCPFDWDKYTTKCPDTVRSLCEKHKLPMPPPLPANTGVEGGGSASKGGGSGPQGYVDNSGIWQKTILQTVHAISLKHGRNCAWGSDAKANTTALKYLPSSRATVEAVAEASSSFEKEGGATLTLVTGSLYLAGNVLNAAGFEFGAQT